MFVRATVCTVYTNKQTNRAKVLLKQLVIPKMVKAIPVSKLT